MIDELLGFDKVIVNHSIGIAHLNVRRIEELLCKGLTAEQRVELRGKTWSS